MTFLQLLFFLLVFLFPVACYLAVLATINRHDHPVMIPGTWDAAGMLFACSGFLLAAGPAVLSVFYTQSSRAIIRLNAPALQDLWSNWGLVWGMYYGVVVLGAISFLIIRRRTTMIYNIETSVFDSILTQVLERRGLTWARRGGEVFIRHGDSAAEQDVRIFEALPGHPGIKPIQEIHAALAVNSSNELTMRIDAFAPFHNVTVRWYGPADDLRIDLESDLRNVLNTVHSRDNPCGGLFFGIASTMFGLILVAILLLFVIVITFGR